MLVPGATSGATCQASHIEMHAELHGTSPPATAGCRLGLWTAFLLSPCTLYPFFKRSSARYDPSWPVIPVIRAVFPVVFAGKLPILLLHYNTVKGLLIEALISAAAGYMFCSTSCPLLLCSLGAVLRQVTRRVLKRFRWAAYDVLQYAEAQLGRVNLLKQGQRRFRLYYFWLTKPLLKSCK